MENIKTKLPFQKEQPVFEKVESIASLLNMNEEELMKYNISLDAYRSNLSSWKNERKEGHDEGLVEGIEIGRKEEKRVIALNLKNIGVPIEQIVAATGLTKDEVEALK